MVLEASVKVTVSRKQPHPTGLVGVFNESFKIHNTQIDFQLLL